MGYWIHEFREKMNWLLRSARDELSLAELKDVPSEDKYFFPMIGFDSGYANWLLKSTPKSGKIPNPPALAILNISRVFGFGPTDEFIIKHQDKRRVDAILTEWFHLHWNSFHNPAEKRDFELRSDGLHNFNKTYKQAAESREGKKLEFLKPILIRPAPAVVLASHVIPLLDTDSKVALPGLTESTAGEEESLSPRELLRQRGVGLYLSVEKEKSEPPIPVNIWLKVDGKIPLGDGFIGVSEIEVGLYFDNCRIDADDPTRIWRKCTLRDGEAELDVNGDISTLKWIFRTCVPNQALSDIYETTACEIAYGTERWQIEGVARIYPLHLLYIPEPYSAAKSRVIDRKKAMLLLGDDRAMIVSRHKTPEYIND